MRDELDHDELTIFLDAASPKTANEDDELAEILKNSFSDLGAPSRSRARSSSLSLDLQRLDSGDLAEWLASSGHNTPASADQS
jgi:type II secretory pathway component PulM